MVIRVKMVQLVHLVQLVIQEHKVRLEVKVTQVKMENRAHLVQLV